MITRLGILTLLSGLFVGIFTGISKFMEAGNYWVDLTIFKILGEKRSEYIIEFTDVVVIQNSLDFIIYEVPFFMFMIACGMLLLFISLFVKTH